ncbi:MAG: preprotein translocase subunit YajC [Bacteroidia bacterium]
MLSILLQAQPEGGFPMQSIIMMVLIFGVFYFFMIRPQQKKQKELKKYRENLQKGDAIVTIGGIHGKITEVKDTTITVKVAEGTEIKFEKSAISMDATSQLAAQTK